MAHQESQAQRLTIYCTESVRHHHEPLYEWLIGRAMALDLSGASAYKSVVGFGRHHRLHHQHVLALSDDLPLAVEIIDAPDRIEAFLDEVEEAVASCTYTRETLRLHSPEN